MICFVILHYVVSSETEQCIESIKKMISGDKRIIVVDNASPNNSGRELFNQYLLDAEVDVILNKKNDGYARGNNIGYKFAREKYDPEFIVIMNNDVEIVQKDFDERIYSIYKKEAFYVLGPDIYSTSYRLHQSPKRLSGYTSEEVKKLNAKYESARASGTLFNIKCLLKQNNFLKQIVYQKRRAGIDSGIKYYNVPLHGACLIFSKKYIEKYSEAFLNTTFFYYECEILDYKCRLEKLKTVYDPSIKVEHHQNISTDLVYKDMKAKTKFANECNYTSTLAFLNYIKDNEGKK